MNLMKSTTLNDARYCAGQSKQQNNVLTLDISVKIYLVYNIGI